MAKKKDTRLVWLVEHPTYRFKEDVKELARKNNLRVVDSRYPMKWDAKNVVTKDKAPKLTLKDEYKPKKADKNDGV